MAVALIAGILLSIRFAISIRIAVVATLVIIALLIVFSLFLKEKTRYRFRIIQGMLLTALCVAAGILATWQRDVRNSTDWYGHKMDNAGYLIVSLKEPPTEKPKTYKTEANVQWLINGEKLQHVSGKIILYIIKDSLSKTLRHGDRLLIRNQAAQIKYSGNPGAFDYAAYMARRQIYYQSMLQHRDWRILHRNDKVSFSSLLFSTRAYILGTLDTYLRSEDEKALAKALLIGYRVELDKDLVQAYSNTGVVHLIAISGLHLAFIYSILYWLASRISLLKRNKIIQQALILCCLWSFAFLTGAPPSVLRAAVMFSCISLGSVFNKQSYIYNSLFASAFILLCYDPFLLWDVGFQLSYIAVSGIVWLHPYIYRWLYFKNKKADYIWNLAAVSIAAQILTVPLCFYYFHQLPLLFLPANLLVIPLSTIALSGCLILIALSIVPVTAYAAGFLVSAVLWLMNQTVLMINAVPFALWKNVSLTPAATLLLYGIFFLFLYTFIHRNRFTLRSALLCCLLFSSLVSYRKWNNYRQVKMIVYNVSQHSAIDIIGGGGYYFIGDESLQKDLQQTNYHLSPSRIAFDANAPKRITSWNHEKMISYLGHRIAWIDTAVRYRPAAKRIHIDYLILSKNAKLNLADITHTFDCGLIIFDASNSLWKIEQWKKECEDLHLRSHSVPHEGAFITGL